MEDFITSMVGGLGRDEDTVKRATGGLLRALGQGAPERDFQSLLARVPGAEVLMDAAPRSGSAGGGLGGLLGKASSFLGESTGNELGALSSLTDAGLDLEDVPRFVGSLLGYLKEKAGSEIVESVLSASPELKRLVA